MNHSLKLNGDYLHVLYGTSTTAIFHIDQLEEYLSELDSYESIICWQTEYQNIFILLAVNVLLTWLFKRYPKKEIIATNLISSFECWRYVLYGNLSHLIQYYWYGLIMMIIQKDWIMVAHHLFTIYGISHCPWYVDYNKVMDMLLVMKFSDLFIHHYKITNGLELERLYPIGIRVYQVITISITALMWFVFRIMLVATMYPFNSTKANILIPIFQLVILMWIVKLLKLAGSLVSKIYVEVIED